MKEKLTDIGIPFEQLALVGIDRGKLASLPEDVRKQLLGGEVTPVIKTAVTTDNNNVVYIPAKLQIVRDSEGNPMLLAYPVRKDLHTELNLSDSQREDLKQGDVLVFGRRYLQMDPETKSVINKPDSEVDKALADVEKIRDIELGSQQKDAIRDGKPVELNVGGEKVTVGIDLREPQMFKIVKGDMDEWNRQKQMRYDEAHPEFMGLVMTDKNRWEYQRVVESQSTERVLELNPSKNTKQSNGLKV